MDSYNNTVDLDCLVSILKYDKLLSKNTMKTKDEKNEENNKLYGARLKVINRLSEFIEYEMGW